MAADEWVVTRRSEFLGTWNLAFGALILALPTLRLPANPSALCLASGHKTEVGLDCMPNPRDDAAPNGFFRSHDGDRLAWSAYR